MELQSRPKPNNYSTSTSFYYSFFLIWLFFVTDNQIPNKLLTMNCHLPHNFMLVSSDWFPGASKGTCIQKDQCPADQVNNGMQQIASPYFTLQYTVRGAAFTCVQIIDTFRQIYRVSLKIFGFLTSGFWYL